MAYSEETANRVRQELTHLEHVEELKMYGGLAFMVNNKMCVCVGGSNGDVVMVRVGKEAYEDALKRPGAMPSIMKNKPVKGYIELGSVGQKNLRSWVELALAFNKELVAQEK